MKSIFILLAKSILFFSIIFLLYSFFLDSENIKILYQILFPSMIISILLLIIHILLSKKNGVIKDFSPNQSFILKNPVNLDVLDSKIQSVTNWKLITKSNSTLIYKSKADFFKSFGEVIKVSNEKDYTVLSSKPLVFTTIFDFGKNYQNLNFLKSII